MFRDGGACLHYHEFSGHKVAPDLDLVDGEVGFLQHYGLFQDSSMISHVFPVAGGKSVFSNGEFSSHGLCDVGGLSVHLERHPFGRLGGELTGSDSLGTKL